MNRSLIRVVLVALLLAGAAAIELQSQSHSSECIEQLLTEGETAQVTIEEPTWLGMITSGQGVYRIDVTGSDGAALQLWHNFYDSLYDCWYPEEPLIGGEIVNGSATMEWMGYAYSHGLRIIPPDGAGAETYTFLYDKVIAPPEGSVLVIPVVTHSQGEQGSFFRTDLKLLSTADETIEVELVLMPGGGGSEMSASLQIEPQQIIEVDDIVLSLFGLTAPPVLCGFTSRSHTICCM
jgi:hypothetical protein